MTSRSSKAPAHEAQPGTAPLSGCGYTDVQVAMLEVMRYFFVAYADPQKNTWERAYSHARETFGDANGPVMAARLLDMVQAMRFSRTSTFRFSNPYCASCRDRVSPSEKHMMDTVRAIDRGDPIAARANALVLCEGHDTGPFLRAARILATSACQIRDGRNG